MKVTLAEILHSGGYGARSGHHQKPGRTSSGGKDANIPTKPSM